MQIRSPQLSVEINTKGAELSSLKSKQGLEFLWQARPDVWTRHAPVLFPVVGRLKDNSYRFQNSTYALSQHGFARDMEFEVRQKGGDYCSLGLRQNSETKIFFPWDFELEIGYRLNNNQLQTAYSVTNRSSQPMYFSIGAHPGFNCPFLPGEKFEDHYLEFEDTHYVLSLLKDGLRSGETKPLHLPDKRLYLSEDLFNQDALVFENNQINKISLGSIRSSCRITIECERWPYFGIWSKKGSREMLCLEPWYGIADSINHNLAIETKEGIICLDKGAAFNCAFTITINE